MRLGDVEDIREWDGDGYGSSMGFHIRGHLPDEEAIAYAWATLVDQDEIYAPDVTIDPPKRTWVRKVPNEYGYLYVYASAPGRGAYPVTLIDYTHRWRFVCDLPGCENHYVKGGAQIGYSIHSFIDPPKILQDPRYVYLCRRHSTSFSERLEVARKAALAELRAAS